MDLGDQGRSFSNLPILHAAGFAFDSNDGALREVAIKPVRKANALTPRAYAIGSGLTAEPRIPKSRLPAASISDGDDIASSGRKIRFSGIPGQKA